MRQVINECSYFGELDNSCVTEGLGISCWSYRHGGQRCLITYIEEDTPLALNETTS